MDLFIFIFGKAFLKRAYGCYIPWVFSCWKCESHLLDLIFFWSQLLLFLNSVIIVPLFSKWMWLWRSLMLAWLSYTFKVIHFAWVPKEFLFSKFKILTRIYFHVTITIWNFPMTTMYFFFLQIQVFSVDFLLVYLWVIFLFHFSMSEVPLCCFVLICLPCLLASFWLQKSVCLFKICIHYDNLKLFY